MGTSYDKDSDDSTMDPHVAELLDEYLAAKEAGSAPTREEFLAQHPKYADRLSARLDGVDLTSSGDALGTTRVRAEDSASHASAPKIIGDYEILGELGRGGMGVVYRARERSLDRIVALKVMRFGIVDPKALERFQREAETAGDLHHTNIVPVYATGREGDTSWYAMQHIEGESLSNRVQSAKANDTPIDLGDILSIGIQAAEALDHAHQREVIHRDVKPANLIIDQQDRVWLTDFGLARRLMDVGATMTGAMIGTPRYMSPEQADIKRDEIDHRTDIYSLGATLFELATGSPPFDGSDPLTVISQIRYEEPSSIRAVRPKLPRDLDVVLAKCLEKDPNRRYATAALLASDLRSIREDRPIAARAVSALERTTRWIRKHRQRVRSAGWAALATVALLLVSFVLWRSWKESTEGEFLFRASAGDFGSVMYPLGENGLSNRTITMNLPMRKPTKLRQGDYEMKLARPGNWSQNLGLHIGSEEISEFRLRNVQSRKYVDIENAHAVAVQGATEPAVIKRSNGGIERITASGRGQWKLSGQVATVPTSLVASKADAKTENDLISVDFLSKFGEPLHSSNRLELFPSNKSGAYPHALQRAIDLDNDGRSDTVIAALDQPSIAAVSADGQVLWARTFTDIADSQKKASLKVGSIEIQSQVTQIEAVEDLNGDGIEDLVVVLVDFEDLKAVRKVSTYVCLVAVSGSNGRPLQTIRPPAIQQSRGNRWPHDGMFSWHDSVGRRLPAMLKFELEMVRHINTSYVSDGRTRYPYSPVALAMPSPVQLINSSERQVVVYHAGNQCKRFDLATGKEIGQPIVPPFDTVGKPVVAKCGKDEWTLLYQEPQSTQHAKAKRFTNETLVIAYKLDGNVRWQKYLKNVDYRSSSWRRNRPDWPLAEDADGDGCDEIVIPQKGKSYYGALGLRVFNASTGKALWAPKDTLQIARAGEQSFDRIVLTDDVDGDSHKDWAVASIGGPGSGIHQSAMQPKTGEAYIYVDWISGKTGTRIAWARSQIPMVGSEVRVFEIDTIRAIKTPSQSGVIEVDYVTGDSTSDRELESMVVRFDPSFPDSVAFAARLQLCEVPQQSNPDQSVRIFRQRPGPYGESRDQLVFLSDPTSSRLRLGESSIVKIWQEPNGQRLAALMDSRKRRLCVVDLVTQETIWRESYKDESILHVHPFVQPDKSVDLLVQTSDERDAEVRLIDGASGREQWVMSNPAGGRILNARTVLPQEPDKHWMLVVGNGRVVRHSSVIGPPDMFRMSIVNARTGEVRWGKYFLHKAPRHNTPAKFDDVQFADLNNDGVVDCIGPDHSKDEVLSLCAWDGTTGEKLWTRSLFRRGQATNYFIAFQVLRYDTDQVFVAYLGHESKGKQKSPESIVLLDGASGTVLDTNSLPTPASTPSRRYGHQRLAMQQWINEDGKPAFGVVINNYQSIPWSIYRVESDKLVVDTNSTDQKDLPNTKMRAKSVWYQDVLGDKTPERIVAAYRTVTSDDDSNKHNKPVDQPVLQCFESSSNKVLWESQFKDSDSILGCSFHKIDIREHSQAFALVSLSGQRQILIDAQLGRPIQAFSRTDLDANVSPSIHAIPTGDSSDAESESLRLSIPIRAGLLTMPIGDSQLYANRGVHAEPDPRRIQRLFRHFPVQSFSLLEFSKASVRIFAATFAIVLFPVFYLWRIVRDRRFSLAWMLLAPLVVMLFLLVYNNPWFHEPSLLVTLYTGIAFLLVLYAYYHAFFANGNDHINGIGKWFLIIVAIVLFCLIVLVETTGPREDGVIYQWTWRDVAFVFYTCCTTSGLLYWPVVGVLSRIRRTRKATRPIGTTGSIPPARFEPPT